MKRISIWKELFSEREPGGVKLLTGHRRTYLGVTVRKNGADQRYGSTVKINQGGTADIFGPFLGMKIAAVFVS